MHGTHKNTSKGEKKEKTALETVISIYFDCFLLLTFAFFVNNRSWGSRQPSRPLAGV
jgi:hypothetical protein